MPKGNESPDEDIGRPGPWGTNRYHQPGSREDESVLTPPGTVPGAPGPRVTAVTRKDYEWPDQAPGKENNREAPGGDAG